MGKRTFHGSQTGPGSGFVLVRTKQVFVCLKLLDISEVSLVRSTPSSLFKSRRSYLNLIEVRTSVKTGR